MVGMDAKDQIIEELRRFIEQQRREMLPPERVDEAFEYDMDEGEVRRLGLTATNEFEVVQKCSTSLSALIFKAFSTPTTFRRTARSRGTTTSGLSFVGHT